ncbi:hypothetical protein [Peribacillus simplex]|nr:hypothetical protein [Peribacillus simplex]WHY55912.1 hypothetical protein QNH43_22645 [Peribacillus simplex]
MANHQITIVILQFTAVHRYKQKKRTDPFSWKTNDLLKGLNRMIF